jgi:hypothetical protein
LCSASTFAAYSTAEATLFCCAIASHMSPLTLVYQLSLWQYGPDESVGRNGEPGMVVLLV